MTKSAFQSRKGFTLVEIMIVILILGIIVSIAIPGFIQARQTGRKSSCLASLKQIETAKEQWAMDNKKSNGDSVAFTDLVSLTLYLKSTPACPASGTYSCNAVGIVPSCSFAGHVLP
jgi:prepilin-type N-terminal cleavage/methylation domain-containing protein